ncbi:MAG: glucose 1-dehydrogenase [Hyphomicrobiales bacterium]|nr:glucose 1-dehydrogenase [Hyphomicrobiales bacterium]
MKSQALEGRVALITGGGGEIGGAIARRFAAEGASVLVADISLKKAQIVAGDIETAGGKAAARQIDVAMPQDCADAVAAAAEAFGKLTTLVNVAAAVTPNGNVEELTLDHWNRALTVNLTAAFLTAKHAVPHMRANGGGSIINIASQLGQIGVSRRPAYSTTKAALIQLTKCLAVDYAGDGIRANSLSPGSINTERSTSSWGSREEAQRRRGPAHLLGRLGEADEMAAGAVFLASDESSFMTGADLLLDGGYLAFKGEMALASKRSQT